MKLKRVLGWGLILALCFSLVACQGGSTTSVSSEPEHLHLFSPADCATPATCSCGQTQGEALGHTYVLGECTVCGDYNSAYCPKLYLKGNMEGMNDKKDIRPVFFEYRSDGQVVSGSAQIKVQGSSSLAYDKKNYTINFYKDSTYTTSLGIDVGWGAQDEYCLKANWIDKTHSRNVVTAKLAGQVQRKYGLLNDAPNNGAVDGFPIEVYINERFHGLYTMNIPKADWQFGMNEKNVNHIVICGENWTDPVLFNAIPTDFEGWSVEVGAESDETLAKIQRLVSFVKDSTDEEFKADFEQYFNLDSTLNYYIMLNYCWMPDNVGKNMLLATYDGMVWYPSLYDLDTTWGPDWTGTELNNYENSLMWVENSVLWSRMGKLFKKEIAERYFELRSSVLEPNYVYSLFEDFYNSIPKEVLDRETEKWDTEETPIPGFPISQIKDYLDSMIPRLDQKYNDWR